jgi:hypothetical protein
MADRAWKSFERAVAGLLGGRRHWSNSGQQIDVESERYIAQCKHVQTCSLEQLTQLAEQVEREAALRSKAGVVAIRCRRGKGKASPTLMVMTAATWERLHGRADQQHASPGHPGL